VFPALVSAGKCLEKEYVEVMGVLSWMFDRSKLATVASPHNEK